MSDIQWFFVDGIGEKQGPYRITEIQAYAREGMISSESLLWYEGLEAWSPAGHFPDVVPHLPTKPEVIAQTQTNVQLQNAQTNPYAAPQTNVAPDQAGGIAMTNTHFQFPIVKPVSFGKYLGFLLGGFIILFVGLIIIGANAPEPEDMIDDQMIEEIAHQMEQGGGVTTPSYSANSPMTGAQKAGVVIMILGGICALIGTICGYIIVYRAWLAIQPGGARTTPGKAVGLLFIPLFHAYWIFVTFPCWANDWNRIRGSYGNLIAAPLVSYGIFLAFPIMVLCGAIPLIGLLTLPISMIFSLISRYQMCKVTNFIALNSSQQQMKTGSGGMKLY